MTTSIISAPTSTAPSIYAKYTALAIALVALQALVLFLVSQPLISADGHIKLWEGVVLSPGNSQHITDWYAFSHVLHGFLFYGLVWLLFRRESVGRRNYELRIENCEWNETRKPHPQSLAGG